MSHRSDDPACYDVVVVGGGPAGATTARCLARAGHRVLLADSAGRTAFKIGEGLPPSARVLLRDLDLWGRFVDENHLPSYGNVSAWGSSHAHDTDFLLDPHGHGWHLDRPRFDRFLRAAASADGAQVREQTVARHPVRGDDGVWRVELRGSSRSRLGSRSTVEARWLVDATGRRCAIARGQGARREVTDSLVSVYARFRAARDAPGKDRDARTLIEAVPDGWWYTALVPSGHRVVAFSTDADLLGSTSHHREGFRARLAETRHIQPCLARYGYVLETDPRGAPAGSVRLDVPVGEGWLAVGDAAISCDPLSSQGILTALYTGMIAGQALHTELTGGTGGPAHYRARLATIAAMYQHNRIASYQLERRWPRHPFWLRRSSPVLPVRAAPET